VDESGLVGGVERRGDLRQEVHRLTRRQRAWRNRVSRSTPST
jgi:hypothetical protein